MKLVNKIYKEYGLLILICLFGLGLRLIQIGAGFWHDEAASLLIATGSPFEVLSHVKGDFHPPLFYWILNYWRSFSGNSELFIRIPFVFLSSLAIPLTYVFTLQITSSKSTALLATLLMATNPLHIYYSNELRMYGLATTLCITSWILLYRKETHFNNIFYSLITILGLFTFYGLWFSFAAQIIVMILRREYRKLLVVSCFAAGLLMWWWPVLKIQLGGGSFLKSNLPGWASLSGDLNPKSVLMIPLKWVIGRLNVSDDRFLLISSITALVYSVFVAQASLKNSKSRDILIALLLPLLIAILISIKIPMLGYWRYIYLIPFFCILLSIGLTTMDKKNQLLNFGALFTIFFFCNVTYFMTPKYWREDWIGVAEFFRPMQNKKVVAIYTFFDVFPAAKWYLSYLPGEPVLNDLRASKERFNTRMTTITSGKESIIVFDYLNDITDKERSVRSWLMMAGFKEKGVYSFRGVGQIYEYSPAIE